MNRQSELDLKLEAAVEAHEGPAGESIEVAGMRCRIDRGLVRVLSVGNELADEVADPSGVIATVRDGNLPVDVFTFLQLPFQSAVKHDFVMRPHNIAVVAVSSYEEWYQHQIHTNTKKKIRKAQRCGVVVEVRPFGSEVTAGLTEIFNETPMRQGRRYPFYGWDQAMVHARWATELERSVWLIAYHGQECIGFIKLVVGPHIARATGTLAKLAHRDKAPMNALLAKAVEVCADRGIPMLAYGQFTYGRKGEDSLTAFKKRSGFTRLDVPRYYVPVSRRGQIGIALGLPRSLSEFLPRGAARVLSNARAQWLQRHTAIT